MGGGIPVNSLRAFLILENRKLRDFSTGFRFLRREERGQTAPLDHHCEETQEAPEEGIHRGLCPGLGSQKLFFPLGKRRGHHDAHPELALLFRGCWGQHLSRLDAVSGDHGMLRGWH